MPDPILVVPDSQTVEVIIRIPPRARGGALAPVVTVTRANVLLNDETGAVVGVVGSDTRVLANVTEHPAFPGVLSGLRSAIDPAFAPEPPADPE